MKRDRNITLDTVAGLAILSVMYNHSLLFADVTMTDTQYFISTMFSWAMPFFFFKSGCFCKPFSKASIWKDLRKECHRLLLPYLVFQTASLVYYYLVEVLLLHDTSSYWYKRSFFEQIYQQGAIHPSFELWFLPVLFASRLVLRLLLTCKSKLLASLTFALFLFTAFYFSHHTFYSSHLIGTLSIGCCLTLAGHWIYPYISDKWSILISGLAFVLILILNPSWFSDLHSDAVHGNYFLAVICSLATVVLMYNLLRLIVKAVQHRSVFLSYLGYRSMPYYVMNAYGYWLPARYSNGGQNGNLDPLALACFVTSRNCPDPKEIQMDDW